MYKYLYITPSNFDNILLESDGIYLTKLIFTKDTFKSSDISYFKDTIIWLDNYFNGIKNTFTPKYKLINLTKFQLDVLDIVKTIEYGVSLSYSSISSILKEKRNVKTMSNQAVGSAIGKNPICIIIGCHRVIGKNGKIIGYSGGINNKKELLKLEGIKFYE